MLNKFNEYIKEHKLIQSNQKVLLAVSGGVDSVVMLDLFHKAEIKFDIAHCNFKLRLFECDDDELFVRSLAHKYNVDIFVNLCNTKDYAKNNKLSIQEAAREIRYTWFDKVCKINNYSVVAVAHQQDDNIETFFINLFRGAGIKGLKCIPVIRQNIIRPIMFATRKEVKEYATKNNLKYREDSSNKSDNYLRNRIRHHLIPNVEKLSPGATEAIKKSINNLNDSDLLLQSCINQTKKELFQRTDKEIIKIPVGKILEYKPLNTWLYYLLYDYNFTRQVTDSIVKTLKSETQPGAKFLSPTHELLIDREHIIIRHKPVTASDKIIEIPNNVPYITSPLAIKFDVHKNKAEFKFSASNSIAYFDYNKLEFPLKIRKWQQGDRLKPFGMNGSKLVSDILIDNKIDSFKKENVYVMLSGEIIIWLIDYRSSREARVTKNTTQIMVMELISRCSGYELKLTKAE